MFSFVLYWHPYSQRQSTPTDLAHVQICLAGNAQLQTVLDLQFPANEISNNLLGLLPPFWSLVHRAWATVVASHAAMRPIFGEHLMNGFSARTQPIVKQGYALQVVLDFFDGFHVTGAPHPWHGFNNGEVCAFKAGAFSPRSLSTQNRRILPNLAQVKASTSSRLSRTLERGSLLAARKEDISFA